MSQQQTPLTFELMDSVGGQQLTAENVDMPTLVDCLHHTSEVNKESLNQLWEKGQKAWKDVKCASEWVDEIRGSR